MTEVAKVLIIDGDNNWLMVHRNHHPYLGVDPDLPGGIVEDGETYAEAMVREAVEEVGVTLDEAAAELVYSGSEYSAHTLYYTLYVARLDSRPTVEISWEHESYEWLTPQDFLHKASRAKSTYMHMVSDVMAV